VDFIYGKKVNVKKPGLRFLVRQFILEMPDVSILTALAKLELHLPTLASG
jgi:hypothetical protein